MKNIRIAAGAGYAGDRIEAAVEIISHDAADYIIFECLAERTIALAQKEKLKSPEKGYNNLLEYRMRHVLPLLKDHKVKIITNMGAANPVSAAKKVKSMAGEYGLEELKIAVVTGDDVAKVIGDYLESEIIEDGRKLAEIKDNIISANAYIGGKGITEALSEGADIVITGRVADPSLTTGPVMYEFGKSYDDYDFLGKTIVAGHLLECGAQVTGGYYADPGKKDVDRLWEIGFPIITFYETGDFEISKLPGTGGLLSTDTVKEQLLYEIQDPSNYYTPDVIADFSNLRVIEKGFEQISIEGATGKEKSGFLKVGIGYQDGFIGTGEISYGGRNCVKRAELAEEILKHKLSNYEEKPLEVRTDIIGVNSLYKGAIAAPDDIMEVRVRIAARTKTEALAETIKEETEALYTNGPAGGGGARGSVSQVVSIASILMDENRVKQAVSFI